VSESRSLAPSRPFSEGTTYRFPSPIDKFVVWLSNKIMTWFVDPRKKKEKKMAPFPGNDINWAKTRNT